MFSKFRQEIKDNYAAESRKVESLEQASKDCANIWIALYSVLNSIKYIFEYKESVEKNYLPWHSNTDLFRKKTLPNYSIPINN